METSSSRKTWGDGRKRVRTPTPPPPSACSVCNSMPPDDKLLTCKECGISVHSGRLSLLYSGLNMVDLRHISNFNTYQIVMEAIYLQIRLNGHAIHVLILRRLLCRL